MTGFLPQSANWPFALKHLFWCKWGFALTCTTPVRGYGNPHENQQTESANMDLHLFALGEYASANIPSPLGGGYFALPVH